MRTVCASLRVVSTAQAEIAMATLLPRVENEPYSVRMHGLDFDHCAPFALERLPAMPSVVQFLIFGILGRSERAGLRKPGCTRGDPPL